MKRYPQDFSKDEYSKKLKLEYVEKNQDEFMEEVRKTIYEKIDLKFNNQLEELKNSEKIGRLHQIKKEQFRVMFPHEILNGLTEQNKIILLNEILGRFPVNICTWDEVNKYDVNDELSLNNISCLTSFTVYLLGRN